MKKEDYPLKDCAEYATWLTLEKIPVSASLTVEALRRNMDRLAEILAQKGDADPAVPGPRSVPAKQED